MPIGFYFETLEDIIFAAYAKLGSPWHHGPCCEWRCEKLRSQATRAWADSRYDELLCDDMPF